MVCELYLNQSVSKTPQSLCLISDIIFILPMIKIRRSGCGTQALVIFKSSPVGFLLWCSRLRICCCPCSGLSHCCGVSLTPAPRNFYMSWAQFPPPTHSQKKEDRWVLEHIKKAGLTGSVGEWKRDKQRGLPVSLLTFQDFISFDSHKSIPSSRQGSHLYLWDVENGLQWLSGFLGGQDRQTQDEKLIPRLRVFLFHKHFPCS